MTRTPRRLAPLLLAASLGAGACNERLTTPADCPALCPGGQPQVFDTVLVAVAGRDSTYTGYVSRFDALQTTLLTNGVPGNDHRTVIRFRPRDSTVTIRDTARTYTIDSVAIGLGLVRRDTAVRNLRLLVYRLPATLDSTATFAEVTSRFVPANLLGTIPVADTLRSGFVRFVLGGASLAGVAIPPADNRTLAIGVAMEAAGPTGVELASRVVALNGPLFETFVRAAVADTALQRQRLATEAAFSSWVTNDDQPAFADALLVGGAPSSRAILRFALPPRLRDSVTVVRATLEILPRRPIRTISRFEPTMQVRQVLSDLGAKSPLLGQLAANYVFANGATDTVRIDLRGFPEFWRATPTLPISLMLRINTVEEGASFGEAAFSSTRSPGGAPRLRLTYITRFPFESP